MGTNCAGCGDPVHAPAGMRAGVEVRLLDDGRHQWGLPGFYGTVVHRCQPPAVVAEAEAILESVEWT